jgi:hypothetical protein
LDCGEQDTSIHPIIIADNNREGAQNETRVNDIIIRI